MVIVMSEILLYLSCGFILFAFLGYIFMIFLKGNIQVTKSNGFDTTKDIISQYNSINIIESKSYFTIYNIKRKVIKIASKCYYGNSISDISLPLIEAGISTLDDNKNKFINIVRIVFSNLKWLYIFPIIAIFINCSTYNISDAKVSMVFLLLFMFISYILIDIKTMACTWISDNLKNIKSINKENREKIIDFVDSVIFFDKFIFFGYLIMMIRFVVILLEIH